MVERERYPSGRVKNPPTGNLRGRPTKGRLFDPRDPRDMAYLKRLIEVDGLTPPSAAAAAGIPASTYYDWMATRPDFGDALKASVAQLKLTLSKRVMEAGKTQWQASMTVLERLFPEEYGRRDRVRHEHAGQVGVQFIPAKMDEASILLASELEDRLSQQEQEQALLPAHFDEEA